MDKNQQIATAFAALSPESKRIWTRRTDDLQLAMRRAGVPQFGEQSAREVFVALLKKGIIGRSAPRSEAR